MTKNKSFLISCSNRSEYGLLRPLVRQLADSSNLKNITACTLLLFSDALDTCSDDAQRDYVSGKIRVDYLYGSTKLEGESVGEHFARLAQTFSREMLSAFDAVIIAGDRYENFALVSRCFLEHVPVIHFFGGDMSSGGHFDDHLRHVISHLASAHFPVNPVAKANLLAFKEESTRVFLEGSPVVDELAEVRQEAPQRDQWNVVLTFNPMTLDVKGTVPQLLRATLEVLDILSRTMEIRCLATRPNNEPGSTEINLLLDSYSNQPWLEITPSLGSPGYWHAIRNALLVIGNSSSQLLEAPVLGTHSLLVGDRQKGRYTPDSVQWLLGMPDKVDIQNAVMRLLSSPRPRPCTDYGVEGVTQRIVATLDKLMGLPKMVLVQKSIPLDLAPDSYAA